MPVLMVNKNRIPFFRVTHRQDIKKHLEKLFLIFRKKIGNRNLPYWLTSISILAQTFLINLMIRLTQIVFANVWTLFLNIISFEIKHFCLIYFRDDVDVFHTTTFVGNLYHLLL